MYYATGTKAVLEIMSYMAKRVMTPYSALLEMISYMVVQGVTLYMVVLAMMFCMRKEIKTQMAVQVLMRQVQITFYTETRVMTVCMVERAMTTYMVELKMTV